MSGYADFATHIAGSRANGKTKRWCDSAAESSVKTQNLNNFCRIYRKILQFRRI
ncbi:hypothetical protein ACWIUD_10565 [Helicobacter sp. 23-1044]